jgi:hypothetical protein
VIPDPCAYLFKNPPIAYDDVESRERLDAFAAVTEESATFARRR